MKRRDALKLAGAAGAGLLGGCLGTSGGGSGDGSDGDGDGSTATETPTRTTATGGDTTTQPAEDTWVRGHEIETTGTGCFSGSQSVTASLADGELVLEGATKAGNPCHEATVASASGGQRLVEVTIGVDADGSDVCEQCIGSVAYEARVAYDGAAPERVVVTHRSMGETTLVLDGEVSPNGGVGGSVAEGTAGEPTDGGGDGDDGDGNGNGDGGSDSESDGSTPDGSTDVSEDYGLRTIDAGCGTGGTASVAFGDGRVTVTGSIGASNPCHEAVLRSAGMDGGRYVIEIGTAETGADACAACLAAVDYEATVDFPDGVPKTVTVVHHVRGQQRTVASAQR